jgi:PTS system cellobiose-specific IIC component
VTALTDFLNRRVVPPLNAVSDNTYLSAIRAGMVAVSPLTIIGGLFMVLANLPVPGWEERLGKLKPLLDYPFTATFGLLAVFVAFAIAYDLAQRLKQDPLTSAAISALCFLLLQLKLTEGEHPEVVLNMAGLGSAGLFTAILVPSVVQESFLSLVPMTVLLTAFWVLRFVLGVDVNQVIQSSLQPLINELNTLHGILVYAFLVTLLWSVGINGDNALDAIVAPVFLQFLAANAEAVQARSPLPYVTANGFFSTFVNVGGTGATIALALVMVMSREPGYRRVARLSLPTQVFQINEPIMFGIPIVLNPLLMIPYVLNALLLTAGTYLLMDHGLIGRPWVQIPWTTPPIIGHYLVTGGDWKAAVWGAVSIVIAMAVYWPFAKAAERQRLKAEELATADKSPA